MKNLLLSEERNFTIPSWMKKRSLKILMRGNISDDEDEGEEDRLEIKSPSKNKK